ncbi:MAG TPA: CHASE2 domain-containing protein, partial [Pseudorhodoferax sp.]|nr:CHASE2 domain-containing protein [Pseudorhodoferax sp.]
MPAATAPASARRQLLRTAWRRCSWGGAGVATALLLAWWQPAPLQRLDLLAYDLLLPSRNASDRPPLVVSIDDDSLARLGSWPWPRSLHARMLDALREAGADAVGLDLRFTVPDPNGDRVLAQAMDRQGKVVLAVAPPRAAEGHIAAGAPPPSSLPPHRWLGHVEVPLDLDGQARRQFLHAGPQQPGMPALALAIHQRAPGTAASPPPDDDAGPAAPDPQRWQRRDEVLLPRVAGLPTVSFAAALADPALLQQARGRAVFVGATASALDSGLNTPLAATPQRPLPAVLFHAQVFDALQSNALVRRVAAPLALAAHCALLLLCALALRRLRPERRPAAARAFLGLVLLGLPLLASAALLHQQLWLAPAQPMAALAVALVLREAAAARAGDRGLRRSREHAQAALQAISEAVLTVDIAHHKVRFANSTALAQAAPRPLQGEPLFTSYPLEADSRLALRRAIAHCAEHGGTVQVHDLLRLRTPQGLRSLRAAASALYGPHGVVDAAVLVFTDMTESLEAARAREYAATHDALTGLPNRVLLHQRLHRMLARVQRQPCVAAILFIDLDRFKNINDALGHRAGDEMLCILAQRLRQLCRDTDTVARWGGDEFVLILEDVGGPEGAARATAQVVEALSRDVTLGAGLNRRPLPSSASVGVVLVPRDGMQVEGLLSKADMALYRAKAHPHPSFHIWASDPHAQRPDRLALEVDLRRALHEDRLQLQYQPQFALDTGRLIGMEALMRWQRTPGQVVQPSDFIQLAEESGLIVDMGAWAVQQAARQLALWHAAGLQPVPVAVNVSARQCVNGDIVQVVRRALHEAAIPPALLRLEITETAAMGEGEHILELLRDIHALGVR